MAFGEMTTTTYYYYYYSPAAGVSVPAFFLGMRIRGEGVWEGDGGLKKGKMG